MCVCACAAYACANARGGLIGSENVCVCVGMCSICMHDKMLWCSLNSQYGIEILRLRPSMNVRTFGEYTRTQTHTHTHTYTPCIPTVSNTNTHKPASTHTHHRYTYTHIKSFLDLPRNMHPLRHVVHSHVLHTCMCSCIHANVDTGIHAHRHMTHILRTRINIHRNHFPQP
jgi:hypothetical protein